MWRYRMMEKISWADCMRNEEVLHRVKEDRNIIHTIKRRKANRNCLLKHITKGKIGGGTEVMEK
jgi:hypothetical protein